MYLYINYYQFFLQSTFVDLKTTFVAANILIISNFAAKIIGYHLFSLFLRGRIFKDAFAYSWKAIIGNYGI